MDQIKKDDPVALFESLGRAVANTTELTGEQVDALGKMMGEDTSARAIAAFRDNFVDTLKEVNAISDITIQKIREINAELKKSKMETDRQIAEGIAENGDTITRLAKLWGSVKSGAVGLGVGIGSAIFKASDVITTEAAFGPDGGGAILEGAAIPFGRSKSAREFDRRQEIQAQFQKAQLEVLKQIRDKTGSGASTDAVVMGGL
jgi:hypothetical protein